MVPCCCRSAPPIRHYLSEDICRLGPSTSTDPIPHPTRKADIGVVVFLTHKMARAEAILDGTGTWRCPTLPVIDRVLNALYEPRRDTGADVPFGHAELLRVAAWLKGEVRVGCP